MVSQLVVDLSQHFLVILELSAIHLKIHGGLALLLSHLLSQEFSSVVIEFFDTLLDSLFLIEVVLTVHSPYAGLIAVLLLF